MSQMGHYFVLFSIRCSLCNVDDSFSFLFFFFISVTKVMF